MNLTSVLVTHRLLLRPMVAEDADALLGVFGDERVMAAFGVTPFDTAQMAGWVARNLAHQAEHGYGLFAVIHRATGQLIGDCGLELMTIDGQAVAELGYDMHPDHWNQGYATEAAAAVRDHAFGALRLPRLVSLIRQGNHASRRVAEKIGLHHTADIIRHNQPYWLYALDRPADQAPLPAAGQVATHG